MKANQSKVFSGKHRFVFLVVNALVLSVFNLTYAAQVYIELDNIPLREHQKMQQWIATGVDAVELTLTAIPASRLNVELVTKPYASEPVPFAQVIRGRPNTVKLQVNTAWPLRDFVDDWTLYHELSHLYFPYLDYASFWLNEGFATYMQYVTMLKGQVIDKQAFSLKMIQGLDRGFTSHLTNPGKLSQVSEDMWRKQAFRRVYWSGAAFFMEVDAKLIQQGSSLAKVVGNYSTCCIKQTSTGEALMLRLDGIANQTLFHPTYLAYAHREDFPSISNKQLEIIALHYSTAH